MGDLRRAHTLIPPFLRRCVLSRFFLDNLSAPVVGISLPEGHYPGRFGVTLQPALFYVGRRMVAEAISGTTVVKQDRRKSLPHLFKKGQSGNPNGRPKGSRDLYHELLTAKLKLEKETGKTFAEVLMTFAFTNTHVAVAVADRFFPKLQPEEGKESGPTTVYNITNYNGLSEDELLNRVASRIPQRLLA